jgi:hypothetical protein
MEKLKEAKKIHDIFVDSINELDLKMKAQLKLVKQEYQQNISQERILLLNKICEGENLDFNYLKNKYLKPKEVILIPELPKILSSVDDTILNKTEMNQNTYYYEAKENGNVYNSSSKIVGVFKNSKIEFI